MIFRFEKLIYKIKGGIKYNLPPLSKASIAIGLLFSFSNLWAQSPILENSNQIIERKPTPKLGASGLESLSQRASQSGVIMSADSSERDTQNETVELIGNVQVIYQDQHLSCDRARINLRSKSIDAIGNVSFISSKAQISGERVLLEYETNSGLIFNGYVQSGNVIFEGSQIQKLSETEYIADDARYTTCTTCPESWTFTGDKIRAELGGYAYIKNSVLKFADIPIFWLPYIAVPLKTDRQSGLLTPTMGSRGLGGWTYSQGYFWAISPSTDATLNLTNYEYRGLKTLANYRFVLSPTSRGDLDFGFLNDRVFKEDTRLNKFRSAEDGQTNTSLQRWFLRYNNYFDLPDGFVQRTQINTASDLQYPKDFPLETLNNGDPAMETRLSLTKNTDSWHSSLDVSYYQNLLQSNPLAHNDNSVHRIPEIQISKINTRIYETDFFGSFNLKYNNFVRFGSDWDNLSTDSQGNRYIKNTGGGPECDTPSWDQNPLCRVIDDGVYTAGQDQIRTGQRIIFNPQIMYPKKIENFELMPILSYNESQYFFPVAADNEKNHHIRRYLRFDIAARTSLSRLYGDFSSLQSERYKHEIQPEIRATSVPWIQEPINRFFGEKNSDDFSFNSDSSISNLDLNGTNGLQYDYYDRILNRKQISVALTNKLTRKSWINGSPNYLQFFTWRLAQTHDIFRAEKNPNTQTPNLNSDISFNFGWITLTNSTVYHFFQKVSDSNTRVRLRNEQNDFIQFEQYLKYDIIDNQEQTGKRTESYVISGRKELKWVDLVGKIGYSLNPADYLSQWGYGTQFRLPGDCLYLGLIHYKSSRDKEPEFELSVNFAWDGNKIPRLKESVMTTFGF